MKTEDAPPSGAETSSLPEETGLPLPVLAEPLPAAGAGEPAGKVWRAGTLTYGAGGLVALFCWLLWGDFAWSMKERSVTSVVQLMLRQLQASDMMAGFLIGSLPSAITMILGPVISYRSDRHRGRRGRRIPYLIATTPLAALSMAGLAFTPALGRWLDAALGGQSPGLYAATMIVFGVFWTVFEIATVAANAVFTGLINDVVPGPLLGRFYGLFRALSLIAGMIFNYWLLGRAESHYEWVFIGVGLLYGVGFTVMCLKVREGEYPLPPRPEVADTSGASDRVTGFPKGVRIYFRECFGNSYYVWVFTGITLATLAFVPVNLFSVFFAKSVDMPMTVYGRYIALTFLISLVFSYPLGWLADRIHPLRASMLMLGLYVLAAGWGGFFAGDTRTFAVAFVLHSVLSGCFFTCSASLGQRLFPHSRFAQFASAAGMLTALGMMLIAPATGRMLDHAGHVYRYTYLASSVLGAVGLVALFRVHSRWRRLGGARRYVAPE
ncbi:MFS transporter [Opitutaceae bacterium TAV5]|nr:MFS transporter [Opitutaceae bacterium TAV5]